MAIGIAVVLGCQAFGWAQSYTPRVTAPSITSRATTFGLGGVGRSFTRQGLYTEGANPYVGGSRQASNVSLNTYNPLGSSNRRPRASSQVLSGPRPSVGAPRYGSLLGGAGGSLRGLPIYNSAGGPNQNTLSQLHTDLMRGNWVAGIPAPMDTRTLSIPTIRQFPPPTQGLPPATAPAAGPSESPPPRTGSSMQAAVMQQLAEQRRTFLNEGWAAFRLGDFLGACGRFSLAERASIAGPQDLAEAKVALVCGYFAAHQFSEAGQALRWLMSTYPGLAADQDLSLLPLMPDLSAVYPRRADLQTSLVDTLGREIERLRRALEGVANDPSARGDAALFLASLNDAQALRLFIVFAIPADRRLAMSEVRAFESRPAPWVNLPRLLCEPGTSGAGPNRTGVPGSDRRNEFPFNMFDQPAPGGNPNPAAR